MKVKVLYFAQVAEKAGVSEDEFDVEAGATSGDLLQMIEGRHERIKGLEFKIAVNQVLSQSTIELTENCEVALLPPFAGG